MTARLATMLLLLLLLSTAGPGFALAGSAWANGAVHIKLSQGRLSRGGTWWRVDAVVPGPREAGTLAGRALSGLGATGAVPGPVGPWHTAVADGRLLPPAPWDGPNLQAAATAAGQGMRLILGTPLIYGGF
ncbi:MAG: hypothetical protein AB1492_03590 [Bacillota bacterium]